MQLVKCEMKDAARLRELAVKTFRDSFGGVNTEENMKEYIDSALSEGKIESDLQNDAVVYYLAVEDGSERGYLKLNLPPAQMELQDERSVEIERIYLCKECQGKGYGKILINAAVEYAREQGKKYIWLGVWEHNEAAIRFYERAGFVRFSEHTFRLGDDVQTDYLLRKEF